MSVRECTIDYLIETTCIYICDYYVFNMLSFMCLFIIMSISVKRHELWCTVRDMPLGKCSIIMNLGPLQNAFKGSLTDVGPSISFTVSHVNGIIYDYFNEKFEKPLFMCV